MLAQLRPLLGADSTGFLLFASGALPFYSNEQDLDELNRYPEVPPPPPVGGMPALVRTAELGVATLEMTYEDDLPRYLASEHYNDHAAPHAAHDTLMMTVATGGEGLGLSSLHFWHSRPTGRTFGDREVALLRLLRPAYVAGVQNALRQARQREGLIELANGLSQAAAVADMDGRIVYMTQPLKDLFRTEPDARPLQEAVRRGISAILKAERGTAVGAPIEQSLQTPVAAYVVRGCLYRNAAVEGPLAVVSVERTVPALPTASEVAEQLGLTPRQAEVALLLAERRRNREIADALHISPHTARHHTQAVLDRLGLGDRNEVRARVLGVTRR